MADLGLERHVEALERSRTLDRPAAVICQTKKGRGVSSMEGRFGFHGKPPTPELAEEALTELRSALGGSDTAAVKAAAEKLATKSQELGGALYAQQAAGAPGAPGAAGAADHDGVVDAEVVEDEGK